MKAEPYLATPYTLYEGGIDAAYEMACAAAGRFYKHRIPVYSPIAHCHGIAKHGQLDALDAGFWLDMHATAMHRCDGLIVWQAYGWKDSYGIQKEIEEFQRQNKPIVHLDPDDFPIDHFREFAREHGWEF